MRYSKEHKAETHQRIVAKAAVKLREKGLHGVGVADLMKDAGLTHGGFYAHFDSRETLVIEAFSRAMDGSARHWRKILDTMPPQKQLQGLVESYLSTQHRDGPGHGCAVPTLGGDIVRESPKTRRAFAAKIEELVALIAETMPDLPPKAARQHALGAMSTMIGAMVLSRIVGPETSDEVLKAGQQAVLCGPPTARTKSAAKPKA